MSRLRLLFILCVASAAWAQSEPAPAPAISPQASTDTKPAPADAKLPDSTGVEVIKSQKADYPYEAQEKKIQGQVILKVLINEQGDVESADMMSGDAVFAQSAIKAVMKWKFKPFIKNGIAVKVWTKTPFDFYFSDKVSDVDPKDNAKAMSMQPPKGAAGDQVSSDKSKDDLPRRIRVSSGVSQGLLIHRVAPVYPQEAKTNRIQGIVLMHALIGKDGLIKDLSVISGPKELTQAAVGAVQQWRYKPYLLEGEPIEVDTQVQVNFTLSFR
jgi:TonB family protein